MIIDKCKKCDCGSKKPIVNKIHYLCEEKNHIRLYGETKQETQRKKNAVSNEKQKLKQIKKPKKKVRSIDVEYSKIIKELTTERVSKCTGCGRFQGGEIILSNSHIISRKKCQEIGRIELIAAKENITYHCLDFMGHQGCHRKWEGPHKIELLDYEKNMLYIKSIDEDLYMQLKIAAESLE